MAEQHRSTARVLDILEILSSEKDGCTLADLSRILDAPKSSLFPIIHTMEERGFLEKDAITGLYSIGIKAYFTGNAYQKSHPLDCIIGYMQEIVDQCHETCHLGIHSNGKVLYIAKIETANPITLRSHVGQALPAYCTGIGKALLSKLTMNELKELYPDGLVSYTDTTITDFDQLYAQLQEVSHTGFAYEEEELTEGVQCIAVPLMYHDKIIASMSVCIPIYRSSDAIRDEIRTLLKKYRMRIEDYFEQFGVSSSDRLF